jgi:hypothetical protein
LRPLKQLLVLAFFEGLNDFADVLGALARTDEQRIGRIDDDQVSHADGGDETLSFADIARESSRFAVRWWVRGHAVDFVVAHGGVR